MKLLQMVVVFFAVVGCLALALGGFFVYTQMQKGGLKLSMPGQATPAPAETTAPLTSTNPEYAAIIKQYQPTPAPTPVAQVAAAVPGQPVVAQAPGAVVAPGVAQVAAAPAAAATPRPVNTPKPDQGLIREWPTGRKWVALTYDDGPHATITPRLIEMLRAKNVKATFFLVGPEVEKNGDIAQSLRANGFELGNHTMTHQSFHKKAMTPEKIREELTNTNELIVAGSGQPKVTVMRPPYGAIPDKARKICEEMGLYIIGWNIDTDDWRSNSTAESMSALVMKGLKDGSIILMHDRHEKTLETTEKIIDEIRAKGYEFVTVSELLGLTQAGISPAPPAGAVAAAAPAPAAAPAAAVPAAPAPEAAPPVAAPAGDTLPAPGSIPPVDPSKITTPPTR